MQNNGMQATQHTSTRSTCQPPSSSSACRGRARTRRRKRREVLSSDKGSVGVDSSRVREGRTRDSREHARVGFAYISSWGERPIKVQYTQHGSGGHRLPTPAETLTPSVFDSRLACGNETLRLSLQRWYIKTERNIFHKTVLYIDAVTDFLPTFRDRNRVRRLSAPGTR